MATTFWQVVFFSEYLIFLCLANNSNFLEVTLTFLDHLRVLLLILILLMLLWGFGKNQEIHDIDSGSKMAAVWEQDIILTSHASSALVVDLKKKTTTTTILDLLSALEVLLSLGFSRTLNHYFSMKFCRKLPWTPNNQRLMLTQKLCNSLDKNSTSKCLHCVFSYNQNAEMAKLWLNFATSFTSGKKSRKVSFISLMYLL